MNKSEVENWCEKIGLPQKLVALEYDQLSLLSCISKKDTEELADELGLKFGKKSRIIVGLADLKKFNNSATHKTLGGNKNFKH